MLTTHPVSERTTFLTGKDRFRIIQVGLSNLMNQDTKRLFHEHPLGHGSLSYGSSETRF